MCRRCSSQHHRNRYNHSDQRQICLLHWEILKGYRLRIYLTHKFNFISENKLCAGEEPYKLVRKCITADSTVIEYNLGIGTADKTAACLYVAAFKFNLLSAGSAHTAITFTYNYAV